MSFLNLVRIALLLGGSLAGYRAAMRRPARTRGKTIAWSAAGGAVGAVIFMSIMMLFELSWFTTVEGFLRQALPFVSVYALFGLVFGFTGVATHGMRWLRLAIITPLVIAGLITLVLIAMEAAVTRVADRNAKGRVFRPDDSPAVGAAVFVDRGTGVVKRLTTDTIGGFRIPPSP